MNIKNKAESENMIRRMGLNRVYKDVYSHKDLSKLRIFLDKNKDKLFSLGDMLNAMGDFRYSLTARQVWELSVNYEKFSLYESLHIADKNLIIQGEISLSSKFNLLASLDDTKSISNREAMKNPKYNLKLDLKEVREPSIKGLTKVIDFMVEHMLFGVIMEFTLFSEPVGTNKEEIIVWELRNY